MGAWRLLLLQASLASWAAFCILPAGDAAGQTETVDQSYGEDATVGFTVNGSQAVAQTFTVGVAGKLTRVDLAVWYEPELTPEPQAPLTIKILRTSETGAPLRDQALASFVLAGENVQHVRGAMTRIDLGASAVAVEEGDMLAIFASAADAVGRGYSLTGHQDGTTGPPYALGALFSGSPSGTQAFGARAADAHFRTYVTVPEPATVVVAAVGAATLYFARRPRRPH